MFKIIATENKVDHKGDLFTGFLNIDGTDIEFDSFDEAFRFLLNHPDFVAEFNTFQIVES